MPLNVFFTLNVISTSCNTYTCLSDCYKDLTLVSSSGVIALSDGVLRFAPRGAFYIQLFSNVRNSLRRPFAISDGIF